MSQRAAGACLNTKGTKDRTKVTKAFVQTPDAHPSEIAAGVFALLERHVSAGEISKVKKALPEGVRR